MTTNLRKQKIITAIFWSVIAVMLLAMGIYAIRDLPMRLAMKVSPSLYLAIEVSTDNTDFVTVFKNYGQETLGENVNRTIKNGNEIFLTGSVFNNIYSDEPIYIRITNYTQSSDVNDNVNYANGPALNAYFTAENGVTNYPSYGLENIAPYNGTNTPSAKTFVVVPQTVIVDSNYQFNLKLELSNFISTEYTVTQNLATGITSLNNFATTTAIPGHDFETTLTTTVVERCPIITQIAITSGENQRNLTTGEYNYDTETGRLVILGSSINGNLEITAVNSAIKYNLVFSLDSDTVARINGKIYNSLTTNSLLNLSNGDALSLSLQSEFLPSSYIYKIVLKDSSNADVAYTEICDFTKNYLKSTIQVPASNITSNLTMTITALPWDGVYPSIAGKTDNQIKAMFAGGEGTVASPYLISNSRQLALLSSVMSNTDTFNKAGVEYKQTNDIYLNDEYMSGDEKNPTPINGGTPTRPVANANGMYMWASINGFYGNYNGNFYMVSGMYYVGTSIYISLFRNLYGNVTNTITVNGYLENTKTSGDSYYGGINGGNLCGNGSTITKCASYITIIQPNCNGAGGVSGSFYAKNQIISNCYFAGYIATKGYTGGIIGYTYDYNNTWCINNTITNNYFCGKIVTSTNECVGAIIGCYDPACVTTATNCYCLSGSITYSGAYSGTEKSEGDLKTLATTLNTNAGEQIWQNAPGLNNGYPTFIKNRT